MKTPDDVCAAYADKRVELSIRPLDDEMVLVEGDEISLEFLGHLILRQARFGKDCGFQLTTGTCFFSKESPLGIYIHRTPCLEKEHGKKR